MYTSDMKNALNLTVEAKRILSWANIVSCPLFSNAIKNNITRSIIHIIVCLLKNRK